MAQANRRRSLWPKEHGAYAQLALPLVTALALAWPTLAGLLLVVAASAAFLAHEPWLVARGARGQRARREAGARARRRLAALVLVGVGSLVGACWLLLPMTLAWLGLPVGLGALVLALSLAGREKTTAGELLAATALPAWAVPVALADGVALRLALACWVAFSAAFALGTLAVRGIIAAQKARRRPEAASTISPALPACVAVALVTAFGLLPSPVPAALVPTVLAAGVLALMPPPARQLRAVGWALAGSTTLTALVFLACVHA